MKHQAEMLCRQSNSGVNLNFDSSTCTPTMSSTRTVISSLSIDGSVANLDGNAFHLIGTAGSSYQNSHQQREGALEGERKGVQSAGIVVEMEKI